MLLVVYWLTCVCQLCMLMEQVHNCPVKAFKIKVLCAFLRLTEWQRYRGLSEMAIVKGALLVRYCVGGASVSSRPNKGPKTRPILQMANTSCVQPCIHSFGLQVGYTSTQRHNILLYITNKILSSDWITEMRLVILYLQARYFYYDYRPRLIYLSRYSHS